MSKDRRRVPFRRAGVFPATINDAGDSRQGFLLNHTNTATATAVVNPRGGEQAIRQTSRIWKPSPCLLTRRELQALILEQLG